MAKEAQLYRRIKNGREIGNVLGRVNGKPVNLGTRDYGLARKRWRLAKDGQWPPSADVAEAADGAIEAAQELSSPDGAVGSNQPKPDTQSAAPEPSLAAQSAAVTLPTEPVGDPAEAAAAAGATVEPAQIESLPDVPAVDIAANRRTMARKMVAVLMGSEGDESVLEQETGAGIATIQTCVGRLIAHKIGQRREPKRAVPDERVDPEKVADEKLVKCLGIAYEHLFLETGGVSLPELRMDSRDAPRPGPTSPAESGGGSVQLSGVRDSGPAQPDRPQGSVPSVRGAVAVEPPRQKAARVQARSSRVLAVGARAIAECLAPLDWREGVRVLLLGDSGCGKSYAARAIRAEYLRRSPGIVGVADSKGDGGWPGFTCKSPDALTRASVPAGTREYVFSADPFGEPLSLESVAAWQWTLAARGWPSLVIYDELSDGTDDGEWLPEARQIKRVWTHGRRPRISAVAGAQFAHQVPREVFEESGTILCWRQAGNALAILRKRHYLEGAGVENAIRALPGDDVPPSERGAFVLLRRARPWNGLIYRL